MSLARRVRDLRPRLRQHRVSRGRKIETCPLLFPPYAFIRIQAQWYQARWCAGVVRLILDGSRPAIVPDDVISAIQARERDGLVELPAAPSRFRSGDRVRIVGCGPFTGHLALYDGQSAHDRVFVLLSLLGASRRMSIAAGDIEAVT